MSRRTTAPKPRLTLPDTRERFFSCYNPRPSQHNHSRLKKARYASPSSFFVILQGLLNPPQYAPSTGDAPIACPTSAGSSEGREGRGLQLIKWSSKRPYCPKNGAQGQEMVCPPGPPDLHSVLLITAKKDSVPLRKKRPSFGYILPGPSPFCFCRWPIYRTKFPQTLFSFGRCII